MLRKFHKKAFTAVGALLLLLLLTACVGADDSSKGAATTTMTSTAEPTRKLVKRAPTNSFIGMRGKKEQQEQEQDDDWQQLDPLALDYADDILYENGRRLKKAPLAFVGVRGKKYTPGGRLGELLQNMEEQRLRESILQDFIDRLTTDSGNGDGDLVKRAPTGFTGMRGKRPLSGGSSSEALQLLDMEELEKRAPVNSFVGVRGKKDVSHQHYKRAALSEAYDARGKKQRYADFHNKFVAVRGKKSGEWTEDWLEEEPEHRYLAQSANPWAYLLAGQEKRAPNGFVGMRGKRPALSD